MACTSPMRAYRTPDGVTFDRRLGYPSPFYFSCGQCKSCRKTKRLQKATRIVHEAAMHSRNCFLTLTYDNNHLPSNHSLDKAHPLAFLRTWRKQVRDENKCRFEQQQLRYYLVGEYGEKTHRPHYHIIVFGQDFADDRIPWTSGENQPTTYRSEFAELIWKKGTIVIGDVNPASANYVTKYVTKIITGKQQAITYGARTPPFSSGSTNPGLGKLWIEQYMSDVYPQDKLYIPGQKEPVQPPPYYDDQYERREPILMELIRTQRRAGLRTAFNKAQVLKLEAQRYMEEGKSEIFKKESTEFL